MENSRLAWKSYAIVSPATTILEEEVGLVRRTFVSVGEVISAAHEFGISGAPVVIRERRVEVVCAFGGLNVHKT